MTSEILQYSLLNAHVSGMLDGYFRAGDLRALGDFGLGAADRLTGEITLADGVFFEASAYDDVRAFGDDETLSFAQITTFEPEVTVIDAAVTSETLYEWLRDRVALDNIFVAYRISGTFDRVKVRRPIPHQPPYPPIMDIVQQQVEEVCTDVSGSLYGFWSPTFFDHISVPRFHTHFLTEDRTGGGHVLDFSADRATIEFERKMSIRVVFPDVADYLDRDLSDPAISDLIDQVEH